MLVAGDDEAIVQAGDQSLGFGRLAGFAALHLDDFHGSQAVDASRGRGPGAPIGRKAGFRTVAQPPDAQERYAQAQWALTPRWPESTDQIFSIL